MPRSTNAAGNISAAAWVALDDFQGTRGAVRVDDSRWNALAEDGSSPRKGDALQVIGCDGTLLKVKVA